jgi:uncharacterized membrane protein
MLHYDEQIYTKVVASIMGAVGIAALYFIIRVLINRRNGKDELDGLL